MIESIEDTFISLQNEINQFIESTSVTYLHRSSQSIVEKWANNIIEIISSKSLQPPLDDKTVERRKRRGKDIFGSDYPLLETGEWITYIEFKINQYNDHDEIEVGVFDETTQVGHTGSRSPAFIAEINEEGREDIHIPGRYLFSTSELRIDSEIDSIITETWNDLNITDIPITVDSSTNMIGKIMFTGSEFIFGWRE